MREKKNKAKVHSSKEKWRRAFTGTDPKNRNIFVATFRFWLEESDFRRLIRSNVVRDMDSSRWIRTKSFVDRHRRKMNWDCHRRDSMNWLAWEKNLEIRMSNKSEMLICLESLRRSRSHRVGATARDTNEFDNESTRSTRERERTNNDGNQRTPTKHGETIVL